MFLSGKLSKTLGYNNKTGLCYHEFKIVDSEFEDVGSGEGGVSGLGAAVIDIYEGRNLNVVANLVKAFSWQNKTFGWPVDSIIALNKRCSPKFHLYEKDINKYLMLV